MSNKNEYNPYGPIDYSFQLLCAGIEIKQPQFSIKNHGSIIGQKGRAVMSVDINEKPMNIDAFCDSETHKR